MNGSGFSFHVLTQLRISVSRAWTLRWSLRRRRSSVTKPKNPSTWFRQEEYVGVKCMWKRGWACSQALTTGGLVGLVVVADQMDVQLPWHLDVDFGQELPELRGAVLAVQAGDHQAVHCVQRSEQGRGPVPDVVVGALLGHAWHHREGQLGTGQRLDLRFFVHAEHQSG